MEEQRLIQEVLDVLKKYAETTAEARYIILRVDRMLVNTLVDEGFYEKDLKQL